MSTIIIPTPDPQELKIRGRHIPDHEKDPSVSPAIPETAMVGMGVPPEAHMKGMMLLERGNLSGGEAYWVVWGCSLEGNCRNAISCPPCPAVLSCSWGEQVFSTWPNMICQRPRSLALLHLGLGSPEL